MVRIHPPQPKFCHLFFGHLYAIVDAHDKIFTMLDGEQKRKSGFKSLLTQRIGEAFLTEKKQLFAQCACATHPVGSKLPTVLSKNQLRVLQFVLEYRCRYLSAPTLQEIADTIGLSDHKSAAGVVGALIKKGYLVKKSPRSMQLTDKSYRELRMPTALRFPFARYDHRAPMEQLIPRPSFTPANGASPFTKNQLANVDPARFKSHTLQANGTSASDSNVSTSNSNTQRPSVWTAGRNAQAAPSAIRVPSAALWSSIALLLFKTVTGSIGFGIEALAWVAVLFLGVFFALRFFPSDL